MGRKTHGPYIVAAIEYNDLDKLSDILAKHFRDRKQTKELLISEVPRLANEYSEVPLLLAASLPDPTIIKFLVQRHEVNINYIHEYGFAKHKKLKTSLLVAVRLGHYDTVDAILSMNGDPNVGDHKGRRPLHHAIRRADYRMAKLLLSRGAQANDVDIVGNTPLHVATIYGHTELVKLLLHHGGDVYRKGQHGAVPIHMAAREGHANIVRLFCQNEVNANIRVPCYDAKDKAPIHVAAERGHAETIFALLQCCRAAVDIRDSEGETPLHACVINEYDPLGMKSKDDYTESVKVLLNHGASVNVRNARGETALHLAARNEFQKVIEVLVLAGCDPAINDNDRNKAIDLVSDEDTVSRQTLKSAMEDRERLMNNAFEVRSKGFVTSIEPQLPLSIKSQSLLSMPFLGNSIVNNSMLNNSMVNNSMLNNSIMSNALLNNMNNMGRPLSAPGFFGQQIPSMVPSEDGYLSPLHSINHPLSTTMRQGSMFTPSSATNSVSGVPRSYSIPEEYDLNSENHDPSVNAVVDRGSHYSKNSAYSNQRGRSRRKMPSSSGNGSKVKRGYPESEVSSLWDVTPNPSGSVYNFDVNEVELLQKFKKVERNALNADRSQANNYSKPIKEGLDKPKPLKFMAVDGNERNNEETVLEETDDEPFFSDGTFDTISEDWLDGDAGHSQQVQPDVTLADVSGSQSTVQEWLEGQPGRGKKPKKSKGGKGGSSTSSEASAPARPPPRVRHPSTSSTETVKRRIPPPPPSVDSKSKKTKAKEKSDSGKVFEVQIDDTQVPGQTIFRVVPVRPPGPARTEVVPSAVAQLAMSQFDNDSYIDMLSQCDFSWTDSISQISDNNASTVSSLQPGKNSRSLVFVQNSKSDRKELNRRWTKAVKSPGKTPGDKNPSGNRVYQGHSGGSKAGHNGVKLKKLEAKTNGKKSSVLPQHMSSHSSSSSSSYDDDDDDDDDTVVSFRQTAKSSNREAKNPHRVSTKPTSQGLGGILKNSTSTSSASQSFLYPVHSQLVKQQPVGMTTPGLIFQRPNVGLDSKDQISKDYLFHKTMAELNSASPEDILNCIGQRPAVQNSFGGGNFVLQTGMMSDLSPNSENRLSGGSFGGSSFGGGLSDFSSPQNQVAMGFPMQPVSPLDVVQLEMKRQHDFQMQQLEYRRQQELQVQQYQQQRMELNRYQEMQQLQLMQEQEMMLRQQEQKASLKPKRAAETSGSLQTSNQVYEELVDGNSEKHVSIASEEYIIDRHGSSGRNARNVSYIGDGKLGCTLKGGNSVGVFVNSVEDGSGAKKAGLGPGDQILKVDGRSVKGKTKEEVAQMLLHIGKICLAVEFSSMKYNSVNADEQPGDHFHVLAHFTHLATKKDELTVRDGEIFLVSDSLPCDRSGFWLAKKVKSCTTSEVDHTGFIPSKQAAELIMVKKELTDSNKNSDKRGSQFARSFRRSKSMDRLNKGKEAALPSASDLKVVAYERVVQVAEESRRPVVIMGLFCGSVRDMLVRDSPGLFEAPSVEVERRNSQDNNESASDSTPLVNERLIQAITNKNKHCLMIISPRAVEYLRQKTSLNPIVIYMSPVSKNVVKVMHAKLEWNVNRKPGFMYEEATKFEKAHSALFSAIVPFRTDATWFSLLKDTIGRIQRLPKWEAAKEKSEETAEFERDSPDIIRNTEHVGGRERSHHRTSKSTDDIPDQIQDLLDRHTYGKVQRPSRTRKNEGDILRYIDDNEDGVDGSNASKSYVGRSPQKLGKGGEHAAKSPKVTNRFTQKRNLKNGSNVETPL